MNKQADGTGVAGGTLYVVATPIGNLQDLTVRAQVVLRAAQVIACEDTRETGKLLEYYGLAGARLLSYHAQSRDSREDEVLQALVAGQAVALVADRGTPGISDPGARLIARAVAAGVSVVPIPGASALITALSASGADTSAFTYHGFIPHKKGRQTMLAAMAQECRQRTVVAYESPHRILKTLEALVGQVERVVLARELTKLHEEFLRGTPQELLTELSGRDTVRGEFVLILPLQ